MKQVEPRDGVYEVNHAKLARTVNALASQFKGTSAAFDTLLRAFE